MIKRFFERIKDKIQKKKESKQLAKEPLKIQEPTTSSSYPNRFLKFYYLNKERLNKERCSSYAERKSKSICVRCSRPVVQGIVFCAYHQEKQKTYNKNARST